MATKKELFTAAITTIGSELMDKIENINWNSDNYDMGHVLITLKEDVTVDDMITVAKIAHENHDDMQINEIKSKNENGKSTPVSNVIEVALYTGE